MPKGYSVRNQRAGATLAQRMAYYSDRSGGPEACWLWTGAVHTSGYGSLFWQGRALVASRGAWISANGPIQDGLHVCHRCDNPLCVNPSHLFLGTQAANMTDMYSKGRRQSTLTADDIRFIRSDDRSQQEIARLFGVSQTTVGRIKRRVLWAHV